MKPDNLFIIFDFIMFAVGIYCMYSWLYMRMKHKIHDNRMTIPSDMSIGACRDPNGYMQYMSWRQWVFSTVCIVFGGLNLLTNVLPLPKEVQFVCIIALFANIMWFAFVIRKSMQIFWPPRPQNPL